MRIHNIRSLDLPDLEPYRTLRRPREHIQKGIFIAEGEKVVRRLLDSPIATLSLLLTQEWFDCLRTRYSLEGLDIYVADKRLLESIVGYRLHQGIMALARVPREPQLNELLRNLSHPFLLVALDGIVSAENVGLIVRNCGALGVHGILADRTTSSPYLRRAVRNSMGAVFRLPVLHVDLIEALPELDCRVIATTPDSDDSLQNVDLTGDLCIVFGNEGYGISEKILQICTQRVAIPMLNGADSLNVASASAVFLYEIQRKNQ